MNKIMLIGAWCALSLHTPVLASPQIGATPDTRVAARDLQRVHYPGDYYRQDYSTSYPYWDGYYGAPSYYPNYSTNIYLPRPRVIYVPEQQYRYAPPPAFVVVPVRPSCGRYRYWNGEYCADARYERPYVGPRW